MWLGQDNLGLVENVSGQIGHEMLVVCSSERRGQAAVICGERSVSHAVWCTVRADLIVSSELSCQRPR